MAKRVTNRKKIVETLTHDEATRENIPTAEYQSVVAKEVESPVRVAYKRGATGLDEEKQRRNRDLDPQLVWRGKDEQDWSDLVVQAPPLYIQEKVHPKVLIDDLLRRSQADKKNAEPEQVKAFRDTWRYGIHSYLTYLRDRLTVARDHLLVSSGDYSSEFLDDFMLRDKTQTMKIHEGKP